MSMVTHTLTLRSLDGDGIDAAMVASLRARGYTVIPPGGQVPDRIVVGIAWETPKQLAERLGLNPGSVCRSLAREDAPAPQRFDRGPSGRLLRLVSTEVLDGWLVRHKPEVAS